MKDSTETIAVLYAKPAEKTCYSPFFLLHGREMVTPANDNLPAKIPKPTQGSEQQVENLKARLRQAYKAVTRANRNSHMANKERYDRRAKHHSFNVGDYVYLYDPAQKPGLSKKFHFYWTCPYQTTGKLSDLNYEVQGAAAKT